MNEARQVRITVPPFFFIGTFLLIVFANPTSPLCRRLFPVLADEAGGASSASANPAAPSQPSSSCSTVAPAAQSGPRSEKPEQIVDWVHIITALAAGGAALFAFGHLIGSIVIVLLSGAAWVIGCCRPQCGGRYDAFCRPLVREWVARVLNMGTPIAKQDLYLLATFDHYWLANEAPGIHDWIQRRWSAFHTSANSACAILLAVAIACWVLGLEVNCPLFSVLLLAVLLLLGHACFAWYETMGMLRFQATRFASTHITNGRSGKPDPVQ